MQTLTFTTETSRVLDLVIHSLYTQRDVFLRELVSNASDALDRFRLETLTRSGMNEDASPLEIQVVVDTEARTLTVRDNGIGMDRDEVVSHIGTIARSGTSEFETQYATNVDRDRALGLIGRFGVGFYSCFMVADTVTLITRRAWSEGGTRWESSGDVHYTLSDAPDAPRGTCVTLHLKPVGLDGMADYLNRWEVARIIKRYADFIPYPIVYIGPRSETEAGSDTAGESAARIVLNSMKPLWTRSQTDVKPEEYDEFYKDISGDFETPLLKLSFKAEGRWEYAALLFVPARAPDDLYYNGATYGLRLYSQRMVIVESSTELLPRYLRFLKGVVDAADLPLNVSRQHLQDAEHLTSIRKWLTRKIVEALVRLRDTDQAKYLAIWREFGRTLKEGISEDHDNRGRLTPLLLFESSLDKETLTSLADYVSRMKPDQQTIFYLNGESRGSIERSPHLEECRARGYEVLYLTEPVDELLTQALPEFEGRRLRSVAKGEVDFGDQAERERIAQEVKQQTEQLNGLLESLARHLEPRVRNIRISRRLTTSPACLTGEAFDLSPQIERILKNKGQPLSRRTLELNASHVIVQRLHERFTKNSEDSALAMGAHLLYGLALLSEGSQLTDPSTFTKHISELLARDLES